MGKPAALEDESILIPDWVLSQEMGHKSQKMCRQQDDLERKGRLDKRRKLKAEQADLDVGLAPGTEDNGNESDTGVASEVASQTDITKKGNDPKNFNILDKIVTVCGALINLSPPIVPL